MLQCESARRTKPFDLHTAPPTAVFPGPSFGLGPPRTCGHPCCTASGDNVSTRNAVHSRQSENPLGLRPPSSSLSAPHVDRRGASRQAAPHPRLHRAAEGPGPGPTPSAGCCKGPSRRRDDERAARPRFSVQLPTCPCACAVAVGSGTGDCGPSRPSREDRYSAGFALGPYGSVALGPSQAAQSSKTHMGQILVTTHIHARPELFKPTPIVSGDRCHMADVDLLQFVLNQVPNAVT